MGLSVKDFKEFVRRWAEKIGVRPKEIHVRKMTKKWGSCSSRGRLTFSYDLLDQEESQIDDAVVHELLHLKVPKHGKLFTSLLKAYLGNDGHGRY